MRKTIAAAAVAVLTALSTAADAAPGDQKSYYMREHLNGLKGTTQAASVDSYAVTDVTPESIGATSYARTTTPVTLTLTCQNPAGSKCGGGGPLTTTKPAVAPVSFHFIRSTPYLDIYWPVVDLSAFSGALRAMPDICISYGAAVDNQVVTSNGRWGFIRDADAQPYPSATSNQGDNYCVLSPFA